MDLEESYYQIIKVFAIHSSFNSISTLNLHFVYCFSLQTLDPDIKELLKLNNKVFLETISTKMFMSLWKNRRNSGIFTIQWKYVLSDFSGKGKKKYLFRYGNNFMIYTHTFFLPIERVCATNKNLLIK